MELLTKTPSQSWTSIHYNFSGDYILRELYGDPWNEARIGKLLEELDALAGTIAVKAGALVLIYWNYWHVCKCSTAIPHFDINVQILVVDSCEGTKTFASVQMQSLIWSRMKFCIFLCDHEGSVYANVQLLVIHTCECIEFTHCSDDDNTTRPLLLVTASVDKMVLKKPISVDIDLKIAGAVTWVGRSSIVIQMEVTQVAQDGKCHGEDPVALTANFTFVALDSKTVKSAQVNPLSPETDREQLRFKEGEARDLSRKKQREEKRKEFEKGELNVNKDLGRLNALLSEGQIFCDMPALADRDSILLLDWSIP